MRLLGLLALACFAAHAGEILATHHGSNVLWSCNVAAAAAALGLFLRRPSVVAASAIMLVVGEPLWLIDLATGGEWMWTSPLTHVGSLALALVGARRIGVPRASWAWATAAIAAATAAGRLGPAAENVNLAYAVPRGWEWVGPHWFYLTALGTTMALGALLTQLVLRRLGFHSPTAIRVNLALRATSMARTRSS